MDDYSRRIISAALLFSMSVPVRAADFPNFPVQISTYAAITADSSTPDMPASSATVVMHLAPVSTSTLATAARVVPQVPAPLTQPSVPETASVPPASTVSAPAAKPVSLDLREMDIVEVLKMLARQQGLNLVIDKNVTGRVTLLLKNVEFWEAFHSILSSRDLAYVKKGDIVEVMADVDYERLYGVPFSKRSETAVIPLLHAKAKTARDMLEHVKSKAGTLSVDEVSNSLIIDDNPEYLSIMRDMVAKFDVNRVPRVFQLNYAKVEELEPKISPLVSKDFGVLQIDKRTNSLVVEDNPARVEEIANVIRAFDVRHKCVLIEAKIMQIILNKRFQTGVNWQGVNWSYILEKLNGYHVVGSLTENLLLVPPATVTPGQVTAPGLTATAGILEKPGFKFVLNLLNTIGNTKILSSPRIMALNREEAKIHVGTKAAKITKTVLNVGSTTSNPVTTENVEFLDVGVKLAVTPTIGDDHMVTLKVRPEVSSVESTITTADGSSIPIIRVSEAEASLVVKDGITVVIGGLMEDSVNKTDTEVPWLGRIPVIGALFRSRDKVTQKTELVIFLTPHIVDGEVVPAEAQAQLDIQSDGTPQKKGFFRRLFGRSSHAG